MFTLTKIKPLDSRAVFVSSYDHGNDNWWNKFEQLIVGVLKLKPRSNSDKKFYRQKTF